MKHETRAWEGGRGGQEVDWGRRGWEESALHLRGQRTISWGH